MTRDDDELPGDLRVELVAPPPPPPVTVLEGALRTSGRPYVAPSPPDELHVVWPLVPPSARWTGPLVTVVGFWTLVVTLGWVVALAAALPLLYCGALILFERTRLIVDRKHLRLSHEPLPLWFRKQLPISTITGVNVTHSRPTNSDPEAGGEKWRVMVRAGDQSHAILSTQLSAEAYALQTLIDRRLGLTLPEPEPEPES